ncbi:MAG TPA: asparagine synthase (glutamine-hydrolyzing) [Herpetosiphonaceae bacterium]
MCGIVGIVDLQNRVEQQTVAALCQAIEHRGPDDHGIYLASDSSLSVGFGSQRLSILDLSPAGHMPMQNEAGDVTLAYNGEIYNHRELRADLERRGFRYRSHTDTETLLHAYEAFGLDCLHRLNGMFAAAIHDRRNGRVVLVRDRMGIKPLYYFWDGQTLIFGSELKALLALPQVPRRINQQALDVYLSLGYVPAPLSLIEGVTSLPAGHYVELRDGELRTRAFWNEGYNVAAMRERSDDELIALTRQTLEDAVRRQLMSDVPVGVLLSGGLDSTIITALAQKHHDQPLDTFAVGFASPSLDGSIADAYNADRHYAALAAQRLGTRHHEIIVREDLALADLLRDLVRSLDEPVWEASFVSIFLLCKLAREHGVKVVLTGDGSDELFAGYSWYRGAQRLLMYQRLPLLNSALPTIAKLFDGRDLGRKASELRHTLHGAPTVRYRANYEQFSPDEKQRLLGTSGGPDPVDALLAPILDRAGGDLVEQFSFADLKLWVGEHFNQRVDRMSMACSVEARVPFQDNAVVDLALGIPCGRKMKGGEQKYLLRRAFADVLPPEILSRQKRPFAAPQHVWLRDGLRSVIDELLSPERIAATNQLDPAAVQQVYQRYLSGAEPRPAKLSILVMFQLWCEEVLAGSPVVV